MEYIARDEAFELLKKYNKDPFHIRHAITVEAVMKGVRPAVVALIAAPLLRMAMKANNPKPFKDGGVWLLGWSLAAALLIWLARVSPVYIIIATIVLALAATWLGERRHSKR